MTHQNLAPPPFSRLGLPEPGLLDGKKSKENKLSPTSVILSSWFLALVLFGLVFLAGTAIGAAFSSSKAPATTLAAAEKPHVPHAHSASARSASAHSSAHASKPKPLTKEEKLEKWYAEADAEAEATDSDSTDSDSTDSATSPALALKSAKTGKKSSSAKAEAAVGVAPKRVTGADARAVFETEVNPARNAKSLIGDRERDAKKSMFADIKQSLSRDSSRVAAALGHSFTPVHHAPKSLQRDPSAPTTLEIAAQEYVSAFAEFSAMELLSKAHDLLVSVDKYELLAAKIDQDDLVDSLLELDTSKPAEPIARVITSEIFASESKTHSWESKKRRAARKLLGGNAMTEKTTEQYAAEFGDALGLDGETLESVLPAAAARAPAAVEEILAKGEDASDDEKSLVAAFHLMAVCARAAPAPIGADVPKVFRPAWEVLLTVLKDVDANALGESR